MVSKDIIIPGHSLYEIAASCYQEGGRPDKSTICIQQYPVLSMLVGVGWGVTKSLMKGFHLALQMGSDNYYNTFHVFEWRCLFLVSNFPRYFLRYASFLWLLIVAFNLIYMLITCCTVALLLHYCVCVLCLCLLARCQIHVSIQQAIIAIPRLVVSMLVSHFCLYKTYLSPPYQPPL